MATTYELIKGETLASSAASYTFTAIPSTYTDLVLKTSMRGDVSGSSDVYVKVNSSWSGIGSTLLYSNSSPSTGRYSNSIIYAQEDPSNATANTFSSNEFYFSNYAASASKAGSVFETFENNATSPIYVGVTAFLHTVASPITSLEIVPSSGNLVSGSSFYLYGIKNS